MAIERALPICLRQQRAILLAKESIAQGEQRRAFGRKRHGSAFGVRIDGMIARRLLPVLMYTTAVSAVAPIQYKLQGLDLAARWQTLVRAGSVSAATDIGESYGVTKIDGDLRFFVRGATPKARAINATLAASGDGLRVVKDGLFVAQLQLSRALRPAPGFETGGFDETSCTPPRYEPGSLVVGDLRLQARPRAAEITVNGRAWDCYQNVAPSDPRGHFLLLPCVDDQRNWRAQRLTKEDCADLCGFDTALALVFNSIGAGASQNHIHAHAWPALPVGAVEYAVERANVARVRRVGDVEVELLDYPLCAVRLRGAGRGAALGRAVAAMGQRPHNVAVLDGAAYLFARRYERAPQFAGRFGAAECLGVFHCTNEGDFEKAAAPGTMHAALAAVSAPAGEVWEEVIGALESLS